MNAKKIFKAVLGIGTLVGTACIAYQTGYQDGRYRQFQEEDDDDFFDDEFYFRSHSEEENQDEPEQNVSNNMEETEENSRFKPLSEVKVDSLSAVALNYALLIICQKKYIHNKILRENLDIDDVEADKILDAFEKAGYVSEKDNNSGRTVYVSYTDYGKLCR